MAGSIVSGTIRVATPTGPRFVGVAALVCVSACGGTQETQPTTPRPVVAQPTEPMRDETEVLPAFPTTRAVLIDGVREAVVLDEVGDFRLVGGAGTIALVGPDGHVRASHRFAFGADGASGVLLTPSPGEAPTHAVVGNGDQDGFRGPWAGELDRWNLDTDTIEQLEHLGYAAPLLARVGPVVVAVSPSEGELFGIGATNVEQREESVDRLGWAPGRPAECYVGREDDETWLVRASADGALQLTSTDSPVPDSPALSAIPTSWPMSAVIGARGLPEIAIEPTGGHLAMSTSSTTLLLGPEGIGAEARGGGSLAFPRAGLLRAGEITSPLEARAHPGRSRLVERFLYPQDEEGPTSPEVEGFREWQYAAQEAAADSQPIAPLSIDPVCNTVAPRRCVRVRVEGTEIAGWDYYDPARPRRVLGTLDQREFPPGTGHTLVAPGGRYVRIFNGSGATSVIGVPRGERFDALEQWVELETGWALLDPSAPERMVFVPFSGGALTERRFEEPPASLAILDATHVLVWDGEATVEVLSVPALVTERTVTVGDAGLSFHCEGEDLVDDDETTVAGGCPVADLGDESGWAIAVSGDRAFWADTRLGDEVHVHRRADDAEITVRVTTQGVLVSSASGVFEGSGAVLDHVVVREPGPVRSATVVAGAEARARFERPGLVAAFFSGAPLPAP